MDWVQEHCERLRSKLQDAVDGASFTHEVGVRQGLRVPWSWVCRMIIETVRRYPSGVTESVILAELELLWRRDVRGAFVPGKLQAYLDAQYAPLSDVIQACVVRHSDQLVTLVEDHSRSVAYGQSPSMVDMYLHQNFKSCLHFVDRAGHDLLVGGRKVRLTGCRMLTGATVGPARGGGGGRGGHRGSDASRSTLLLTEYLAFVLDHRRSEDVGLAAGAFGQTRVRDTLNENANRDPFLVVCKVVEVRRPRQHHDRTSGSVRKRRMMVQTIVLECARRRNSERGHGVSVDGDGGGEAGTGTQEDGAGAASKDGGESRETVLFHLWDDQICLAALFRKGDGLAIFWPWLVQSEGHDAAEGGGGRVGLSQQLVAALPSKVVAQFPTPRVPCWHYEYGSATALFVLPRESRTPLIEAANGNAGDLGATTCDATAAAGDGDSMRLRRRISRAAEGTEGALPVEEMPTDENGVRDLLQFPRRVSVADLAPNMSNVSIYGQVVSVCVPSAPLPAVLPSRAGLLTGHNQQASFTQPQSEQPLLPLAGAIVAGGGGGAVVELGIRDDGGETRVLCCGREAAVDALRCRPGHFVLACGLRTFTPAFPSLLESQPDGSVVVLCGEPEEAPEGQAATVALGEALMGSRPGADRGGGGGGGDGISRILNASCLEGLLHCPYISRHSLLHSKKRTPGPRTTFACKVAITRARWALAGDGLWVLHRRCRARLPCHYGALGCSRADLTQKVGRKRWREVRDRAGSEPSGAKEARVTCPHCKSLVRVASAGEAELGYAPLLLALDDGSRCIVAECRDEVVTAALAGINAHVFIQMDHAERASALRSLVGREIRCVVGGNGAVSEDDNSTSNGRHAPPHGGGDARTSTGSHADWGDCWSGGVQYRVECIASANPAADLGHLLVP